MNPYRLKNVFEYLTSNNQLLKKKLKLGTSEIPIPPKRQDVIDVEVINRFTKANPRVDTTNLKPLSVKHSKEPDMKADGGRIGYKDGLGPSNQPMGPVYTTNKIEDAAKKNGIDIVFLDISLPPSADGEYLSGEDLGIAIKKLLPKCKIVVATTFNDNYRIQAILKNVNPDGFLIKNDVNKDELVLPNYEKYKHIKISAVVSISGAVLNPSLITTSNSVPGVFFHGIIDKVVPYNEASHRSCKATDKGYLPLYGSKKITESISSFNTSNILISYKDKGHDLSKIPSADFFDITFKFIKKVVIDNEFYQAQITQ